MKTKLQSLASLLALCSLLFAPCFLTGCATGGPVDDSGLIQTILNQVVPADFVGDLKVDHTGHYFGTTITFNINLKGLSKANGHWTWKEGGYTRSGVFSNGGIMLIPSKAPEQDSKPQ